MRHFFTIQRPGHPAAEPNGELEIEIEGRVYNEEDTGLGMHVPDLGTYYCGTNNPVELTDEEEAKAAEKLITYAMEDYIE